MENHKNELGGISLVVIMALGSIAAAIFLGLQSSTFNISTVIAKSQESVYCQDMVDSSFNNLRSLGPVSLIQNLPVGAADISGAQTVPGLNPQHRWPTTASARVVIAAANQRPTVSNYQVLEGAMSSLNAILNSRQDAQGNRYCESVTGGRYVSNPGPPLLVENAIQGYVGAPTTFIRIQLIDLTTGQLSCPSSYPIYLRPRGNQISPHVQVNSQSTDRYGFQVTITSSYDDLKAPPNTRRKVCSDSSRFVYPKLQDDQLNQLRVEVDVTRAPGGAVCSNTRATGRATITYLAPNPAQRGTVLLCKDNSVSIPALPACDDGSGARAEPFTKDAHFQPCASATLCGRAPVRVTRNADQISLEYSNLPWSCEANMGVIAVDPALNDSNQPIASASTSNFSDTGWFRCHRPSCACGGWSGCPRGGCYACPPPPPPAPPVAAAAPVPAAPPSLLLLVNCVSSSPSGCPGAILGGGCGQANPTYYGTCTVQPLTAVVNDVATIQMMTDWAQTWIDSAAANNIPLGTPGWPVGTTTNPPVDGNFFTYTP